MICLRFFCSKDYRLILNLKTALWVMCFDDSSSAAVNDVVPNRNKCCFFFRQVPLNCYRIFVDHVTDFKIPRCVDSLLVAALRDWAEERGFAPSILPNVRVTGYGWLNVVNILLVLYELCFSMLTSNVDATSFTVSVLRTRCIAL